jgi:hypothetical protein
MKKLGPLLIFAASLSFAQSPEPSAPVLTPLPPKPTCVIILRKGACADLWGRYNQAVAQRLGEQVKLYANRQAQLESAPLQQQITDLNKLITEQQGQIKNLQEEMQSEYAAALQAKADTHTIGLQEGVGWGVGAMMLLVGIVIGARKMTQRFAVTKMEQAKAASA